MKIPVSWLKEYVAFEDSIEGLVEKLTFSGLEVEAVETVGAVLDERVVVGEVTAVERHPNADALTLCTVSTDTESATVVCGAPNVVVGGKYPFASVGVTLPNGMKLKKAKIRGVESLGMLCAEDELGLSDDHTGLLTLDSDLTPGTPMRDVLAPPETVIEVEVTPNRPDCLSLIGIAREVAALYGAALVLPPVDLQEAGSPVGERASVVVEEEDLCPRYTARVLENVALAPSPPWMQHRLTLAGIRPINNVVDITNYVLLETGHPLHAFDLERLSQKQVVVRRAQPGEIMRTLDEVERRLSPDMLIIADAAQAVAVAGVMGGAGSEIHDDTHTVLLESACFDPASVRATSRELGLRTDSSYRFERGVNIDTVEWASRRAARLMQELASATICPGVIDHYPQPVTPRRVTCRFAGIRDLIGLDLDADRIVAIFESLQLRVVQRDAEGCELEIPIFRGDLEREVDLAEEVARIHGLDRVPAPAPMARLIPGADDSDDQALSACRRTLVGLGLREIMNYSLTSPALLDLLAGDDPEKRVVMPHPLSQEQSVLRSSLLPQMGETLARNHARQIRSTAFFEVGRTYRRGGAEVAHEETVTLCIGLMGPTGRTGLDLRSPVDEEEMLLGLKGVWTTLARAHGFEGWTLAAEPSQSFEPGFSFLLRRGKALIGRLGLLPRKARQEWRFTEPVGLLEVDLQLLLEAEQRRTVSLRPVPAYPSVSRDIALIVDRAVKHEEILAIARKAAPKELEHVELFDIFEGKGIESGKKSMAYSFTYRSMDRTLTDEDANRFHEKVSAALVGGLNARIRDH